MQCTHPLTTVHTLDFAMNEVNDFIHSPGCIGCVETANTDNVRSVAIGDSAYHITVALSFMASKRYPFICIALSSLLLHKCDLNSVTLLSLGRSLQHAWVCDTISTRRGSSLMLTYCQLCLFSSNCSCSTNQRTGGAKSRWSMSCARSWASLMTRFARIDGMHKSAFQMIAIEIENRLDKM